MAGIYTITRTSTALSTTNDYMTIIAPASRSVRILSIRVTGGATASAYNEILVSRSTGGATGGGAITPQPVVVQQAASGTTVNTTWGTQPTLGVTLDRIGVNANGGIAWVPYLRGQEIELRNSEQLSLRSASGTSSVAVTVTIEEL